MLAVRCTVRGCGGAIPVGAAADRRMADGALVSVLRGPCGHCFDIARSGYINMLQPQDSRSRDPGDTAGAVAARRRLLDAGMGATLLETLSEVIADIGLPPRARALDIGSGEGSLLGALAARFVLEAAGVDLSARAVDLAARRYPNVLWLVANADRGLPFVDGSLDLTLSITARRNPAECSRVLNGGGHLVIAVPGPDDQAELREAALGSACREDRVTKVLEEHRAHFELVRRRETREKKHLTASQLEDLLASTYRDGRAGRRERVRGLAALDVTLNHEIVVLARRISRANQDAPPPR